MKALTDTQWAYLAGIFDGEGSVFIRKSDRTKHKCNGFTYAMGVTVVCGTDINLIATIMSWFEKDDLEIVEYGDKRPRNKTGYRFRLYANEALSFLQNVQPMLITKKERADLAIEFQKSKKYMPKLTDEERQKQEEYFIKLKELNKRGIDE